MAKIGPTFVAELADAGLTGAPCAWSEDGSYVVDDLTNAQRKTFMQVLAAHDPRKAPPATFLARDLLALLSAADYAAIVVTTREDATLGLLWACLLAQGDAPISTGSPRFVAGWAGLSKTLGAQRAAVLSAALLIRGTP